MRLTFIGIFGWNYMRPQLLGGVAVHGGTSTTGGDDGESSLKRAGNFRLLACFTGHQESSSPKD
jgi:hypothetical protein